MSTSNTVPGFITHSLQPYMLRLASRFTALGRGDFIGDVEIHRIAGITKSSPPPGLDAAIRRWFVVERGIEVFRPPGSHGYKLPTLKEQILIGVRRRKYAARDLAREDRAYKGVYTDPDMSAQLSDRDREELSRRQAGCQRAAEVTGQTIRDERRWLRELDKKTLKPPLGCS